MSQLASVEFNRQVSSSPYGEVLVRVEGVSKKFCRSLKKSLWYGLCDVACELDPFAATRTSSAVRYETLRVDEFWAVDNISFELRRGECLGLVGRNGAGKTTLLKVLNGLIKPDAGRIEMRGRVGALIALGAGFNPILTGRENIYVNGSILGLKKREIDERIEEIIDFAEIRDFIDAPVQSYSSGMQVRLGFAVATALDPDILILDEVLAVGDSNFRTKCFRRIASMINKTAIIFVSHSEEQLSRICSTGLFLQHGGQIIQGPILDVLEEYRVHASSDEKVFEYLDPVVRAANVKIGSLQHVNGENLALTVEYEFSEAALISTHFLGILAQDNSVAAICDLLPVFENAVAGKNKFRFELKGFSLKPGKYKISMELWSHKLGRMLVRKHCFDFLRTVDGPGHKGGSFVYSSCHYMPTPVMCA